MQTADTTPLQRLLLLLLLLLNGCGACVAGQKTYLEERQGEAGRRKNYFFVCV